MFNSGYWKPTVDKKHGLGILFGSQLEKSGQCFYEDNTLQPAGPNAEKNGALDSLLRDTDRYSYRRRTKTDENNLQRFLKDGECLLEPGANGELHVLLSTRTEQFKILIGKNRFFYEDTCSCKKSNCIHIEAASMLMRKRLENLQHMYVLSDLPVDKTLFLDPELETAIAWHEEEILDEKLINILRHIVRMIEAAHSDEYYRTVHEYLLEIEPRFDYDSHFLEDNFGYLFLALFENAGYQQAVLEPGDYADPGPYDGRQRKSNRSCLKRLLKEYTRVKKEMDRQENYGEDLYKEFLLKYRGDLSGLLRYYAEGKKKLELLDLPFLNEIAECPGLKTEHLQAVAMKLDPLGYEEGVADLFGRLARRLAPEQRVELLSRLQTLTISMDEVKQLPKADQLKLINSVPLKKEYFLYIMDQLLADSSCQEKGHYILCTLDRLRSPAEGSLRPAILSAAMVLPENRLLVAYIRYSFQKHAEQPLQKGDPEKEITFYFHCDYKIVNEGRSFYTLFKVTDPESDYDLLTVREENGRLEALRHPFPEIDYTAEQIRKVCLKGREEEYQAACEKNREAVDAYLFATENRRFAEEYRELCASVAEEKLILAEDSKAEIEWMIYREGNSNALAFKVGNSRKYIVKDASEFISAFRTGQTTSYGKDLILTHDPDNLRQDDAAVIRLLMAAKFTRGRKSDRSNKRYITVSSSLLSAILEMLTGRTVYYNDIPCVLRMDPVNVWLRVSDRYVLETDIDPVSGEYLDLSGKAYVLTYGEKHSSAVMDRHDAGTEMIQLTSLIRRNPGVCIKPILKDFLKNIYARFFEAFDIDKKVQSDFVLSRIRLNTYFDFESPAVTYKTTILREEKEIYPEMLTDRIDRARYEALQEYLGSLGFADGRLEDDSRVLQFFKLDFTRLKKLTNVYLSENLKNKELNTIGKPVIRVSYKNNLVSVFLEKSDYSASELEQIMAGLRKKKKYILLDGNRIIDLESETARDFGEAVKDFGMDPKDLYKKKTISFVTAIKAFSHEKNCRTDKYLRDMIDDIRTFKEADIELPKLGAELREYQKEGFKWLSVLSHYNMGGILADDMGLGKTIQIIALIRSDKSRKPSLVVCPKSLVFNWVSEFARFDGNTPVTTVYGPDAQRSESIASIDYQKKGVYITSYDSLRNDIGKYAGTFNYVILDEAQYIKNVHAQKTKSVKELKAAHRFALTGTPIENSVVDLWSIFDFIMPGYFDDLSQFKNSDTADIARKAAPFILRRVKEDVLEDLPAKYERILSADMSSEQRRLYEAMRNEARMKLEEGGRAFDILPYLTRLRQVCVDPEMFVEGYHGGSGKLDMLASLVPEYLQNHHRILIFSQFVKALEVVRKMLEEQGIAAYFLSGSTPAKERLEMMDAFNNGSGTDVFLISLKAGGTGLNLTGADTVIHLDPWWNVAAENQASDRTHRIGQTRNVEVIRLIAADSIEQRVAELQDIKKAVIKQVISDDDGSVTSASLEDIAFVLK